MPDDTYYPPDDDRHADSNRSHDDQSGASDVPPSTIFVELMRQAAARRAASQVPESDDPPTDPPPSPPRPEADLPFDFSMLEVGDKVIVPDPEAAAPAQTPPSVPDAPSPPQSRPPADSPPQDTPAESAQPSPDAARRERYEAAMREQRIRRVKRRRERRRRRRVGMLGGFLRTVIVVVLAAGLASTIFTWFTSPDLYNRNVVAGLQIADATGIATVPATPLPTPNWFQRIGIVSGHRGPENDPGAVCPDGLTEAEINFNVAQLVVRNLRARGYTVDLLDEFDPRLNEYQAAALVSIHANTCTDYGEVVSGFLVAKAASRPEGGPDSLLAECIAIHYSQVTGLERRFTLTLDMTDYHSFREIHALTPAAILELGFMFSDRQLLTEQPELLAEGIARGVLCYLEPQAVPSPPPETTPETIPPPDSPATQETTP